MVRSQCTSLQTDQRVLATESPLTHASASLARPLLYSESNSAFMHSKCPLSCGICNTNCSDTHASCVDCEYCACSDPFTRMHAHACMPRPPHFRPLAPPPHRASQYAGARKDECTTNTAFMLRECPVACGLCTPPCVDTNAGYKSGPSTNETMCDKWARDGECEHNPDFALKACPVACGLCKLKCKDLHDSCSAWAADGQCRDNAPYMMKECPAACGVCGHAGAEGGDDLGHHGCHDLIAECAVWAGGGECARNPEMMLRQCAKSCDVCKPVCQDHHESCAGWSKVENGCEANPQYMHVTCPASCGVCQVLHGRKDEL